MSTTSPGPWQLQRLTDNWHGFKNWSTFAIRSTGNNCIAVVGEIDRATEDHNAANATLITAAPDLLSAIERLMGEFLTVIQFTPTSRPEVFASCLAQARMAISKAKRPIYKLGDQVQSIECNWQGRVTGFRDIDDVEMLECHHVCGGEIELDDKRWFDPRDVRRVAAPILKDMTNDKV